jgi:serine/threonine-protein kinase OSR1/STK39
MAKAWEKVATAAGLGGSWERRKYPIRVEDYELYEEIGQGVSAIVYRSLCKPLDEIVAVKVLDFERTNSDLVRLRVHHLQFVCWAQSCVEGERSIVSLN